MDKLIETYRGVAIERTAEVVGFRVRPEQAVCIQVHFRREDDAPIIDMFASVEDARSAIDDEFYDLETFETEFLAAEATA